jgi:glycosyltransferase involved in cell wall biosynthesis
VARYPQVRLLQHARNSGTAGASRNTGIAQAAGEFIVCLDADDLLEPSYLATCYEAIHDDPGVGVVCTGVQTLTQATGLRTVHTHWPIPFDWAWSTARETPPHNCIPTASMFRRAMWERSGGYNAAIRCGEDAEFWVRALSAGFEAVKCTDAPLFVYRRHGPSMSTSREWNDLAQWNRCYRGFTPLAAPTGRPPVQRDYTHPAVTVIIPVGPGHAAKLPTAIESVLAQTVQAWEIVAVNDSGDPLPLRPYPFVRAVSTPRPASGAGVARNSGLAHARAPLVFFLDADDYILPQTLERMLAVYGQGQAGYVYSGWLAVRDGQAPQPMIAADYDPRAWLSRDAQGLHGVSVLMARADAQRIGGFDESLAGFEDWDFFIKCAIHGLCGVRVPEALLGYRLSTGARRNGALARRAQIVAELASRYGDYFDGRKPLMACCGGDKLATPIAAAVVQQMGERYDILPGNQVYMQFIGSYEAPVTYYGKYSGCRTCPPVAVELGDVPRLEATGVWRAVPKKLEPAPEMAPIAPAAISADIRREPAVA